MEYMTKTINLYEGREQDMSSSKRRGRRRLLVFGSVLFVIAATAFGLLGPRIDVGKAVADTSDDDALAKVTFYVA